MTARPTTGAAAALYPPAHSNSPPHFLQVTSVANQTLFWSLSSDSPALQALYAGPPLPPSTHFIWRLRARSTCLHLHAWSQPHMFITSLDRWSAVYISPPLPPPARAGAPAQHSYARTAFTLPCDVSTAALHMSGIGYSVAFINGNRVGDHELSPTWTRYEQRVMYVSHDVTHLLRRSTPANSSACHHVIDVILGSGHFSSDWYGGALSTMLLAQVNAQASTPAGALLVAAATRPAAWAFTSDGPVLQASLYGGETFNASALYHEHEWRWVRAACSPPMPRHPSDPSRTSPPPSHPPPLQPLQQSSPPASVTRPSPVAQSPPFDGNCSLTAQLNGSDLVAQRQVSDALTRVVVIPPSRFRA